MERSEVTWFRRALAIYLVYYYAHFVFDLGDVFGSNGLVDRAQLVGDLPSLLLHIRTDFSLWICFVTLMTLTVAFGLGRLGTLGVVGLFVLNLSFHNASPYIIHEPQQLTNLFIASFLFLPAHRDHEADPFFVRALTAALAIYYLTAAIKKLPDPHWWDGSAVSLLAAWPGLRSGTWINGVIVASPVLGKFATYGTLLFEVSFPFFVWTRWRPWWLLLGVLFHLLIHFTVDVGTFSEIMMVWYAILLDRPTLRFFRRGRFAVAASV